jgi:DNA-binding Lrp family transcriptional regulator
VAVQQKVRGYILVEAGVGTARSVGEEVMRLTMPDVRVVSVDTVTGPYDVIVQLEAEDLDRLGRAITEGLQRIQGVQRTTTCLAVNLS